MVHKVAMMAHMCNCDILLYKNIYYLHRLIDEFMENTQTNIWRNDNEIKKYIEILHQQKNDNILQNKAFANSTFLFLKGVVTQFETIDQHMHYGIWKILDSIPQRYSKLSDEQRTKIRKYSFIFDPLIHPPFVGNITNKLHMIELSCNKIKTTKIVVPKPLCQISRKYNTTEIIQYFVIELDNHDNPLQIIVPNMANIAIIFDCMGQKGVSNSIIQAQLTFANFTDVWTKHLIHIETNWECKYGTRRDMQILSGLAMSNNNEQLYIKNLFSYESLDNSEFKMKLSITIEAKRIYEQYNKHKSILQPVYNPLITE